MAGLMSISQQQEQSAMGLTGRLSDMQRQRKSTNDQLVNAEQNQRVQATMAGAGTGTMIVPGVGTVIGAVIGAGAGFALSYFL